MVQSAEQLQAARELAAEYGLTGADFYQHKQSRAFLISRTGIEKIQYKAGIEVGFTAEKIELEFAAVKATASRKVKAEGKATATKLTIQTFGSASKSNCQVNYYLEMAEKRALSRAVLKLTDFYQLGVYGEDEMPPVSFRAEETAPAVAPAVVAEPAPVMRAVTPASDPLAASQPPVQYARAEQKEEIIRLLNHPLITRQEKTKMLLNIHRLDEERADQAINKLTRAIADREGTTAVAEPAQPTEPTGNEPAGAPQAATPARLPFADTAVSTTSAPNEAPDKLLEAVADFGAALTPGFSSPEVAAIAQQIEGFTSSMDLKKYWDGLTGGQRKELLPLKDTKQRAILAAIHQAAATASRQNGGAMRPAGTDSALVDEFVNEPVVVGADFGPATPEQRNQLVSLLNDTLITFKEKSALLKAVSTLDTERARQALITVRGAIEQRMAAGVAAQVAALADRESGETNNEAGLQAA